MHVVHLTSAHPRYDTRVFVKQCRSLAALGYKVTLVVADGKGDERRDGVEIIDVGPSQGRIDRMLESTRRVYTKALALDAGIYHLHDPELIPYGLRLKRSGKTVIFDAHEDLPKQLLGKPYLGPVSSRALSGVLAAYEAFASRRFDGIVAATPSIRDKFLALKCRSVDINNFPIAGELGIAAASEIQGGQGRQVCYVGGLTEIRGVREMVRAAAFLRSDTRIELVGAFNPPLLREELLGEPGWARIKEHGYLDRAGVARVMQGSMAGLVTLRPAPNHIDSQPNKMFEYMSAGLPVIASDFPLWRAIIEDNACGICVDPGNPRAIANAIDFLVSNSEIARRMGESGRELVRTRYNWVNEERKLVDFYAALA
ncbi:glycosyltransferase family 4 protein [Noviherbaspirillum sp. CPCC 100848]|uniref:Glycosyltransferase family 4 protein n=1 Tax=Noviherbaspirillum album TaxID=3080276 RepID=A0ABU6J701_9BURK|nr:glycosyltransferase family 4 protein [Noviherbaspirillum sp. CPCC 100848]MEC4719422.1 glycosyltransferase family 4 protein [Noviherbaspirillum sp. CPCC 100848]